jgi:hypothetical protein
MPATRDILGDSVTAHMRTDPTRIQAGLTVAQALDDIRDHEVGPIDSNTSSRAWTYCSRRGGSRWVSSRRGSSTAASPPAAEHEGHRHGPPGDCHPA